MDKAKLIKKICDTYGIKAEGSYEATALYLKGGLCYMAGCIVNDTYFIDERTEIIYSVSDLTGISNVDEYND